MNPEIHPTPTDDEAVAIAAATEVLWPKPVVVVGDDDTAAPNRWRFSGRWWSRPLPLRRDRPF